MGAENIVVTTLDSLALDFNFTLATPFQYCRGGSASLGISKTQLSFKIQDRIRRALSNIDDRQLLYVFKDGHIL